MIATCLPEIKNDEGEVTGHVPLRQWQREAPADVREAYGDLAVEVKAEKIEKKSSMDSFAVIRERWYAMTGRDKPEPIPLKGFPEEQPPEAYGVPYQVELPLPGEPDEGAPARRGPGRPKGSKNRGGTGMIG